MDEEKETPGDGNAEGQVVPTEAKRATLQASGSQNCADAESGGVGAFADTIEFLRAFAPPWNLTAITVEGKKETDTRSFDESSLGDLVRWLEKNNDKKNLYFQVNPSRALNIKAKKEDITALAWLHVDLDPDYKKETLEQGRARALDALQRYEPKPTFIVDSGGGYQGFWRLSAPVQIVGGVEQCEELELYNIQLAADLGGDHCHNIDRIMRLPGTWNIPDERKRKNGRQPALAKVEKHNRFAIYEKSLFKAALKASATKVSTPLSVDTVNVARVADITNAPELKNLPDKWRAVILHGKDPADPDKHPSRSEWLWAALLQLFKAGVDDATVFSLITDKDYGISASILDKPRWERVALKQMEKAKVQAADPVLAELNERHAVVENYGGRCVVMTDDTDPPQFQSFENFAHRYRNRSVMGVNARGTPTPIKLGQWWSDHPARRQYRAVEFMPGTETPDGVANLWRGWAVTARSGDCSLWLAFVRDVICSGDQQHYEWLMDWMAHGVQRADHPGEVAVVLRGGQGIGKSYFAEHFGELFEPHFVAVSDPQHVVGNFNKLLHTAQLVFSDEAFAANDPKAEGVLKALVTQEHVTITPKGVDSFKARKFLRLIMASNHGWVVPADLDDRRFFVMDVSAARKNDHAYFAAVQAEWKAGGREAFMAVLRHREISAFNHRERPETVALAEQKIHSFRGAERAVFNMLWSGDPLPEAVIAEGDCVWIAAKPLADDAKCKEHGVAAELKAIALNSVAERQDIAGARRRAWRLPPLNAARHAWEQRKKLSVRWPEDDGHWTSVDAPGPF